MARVATLLPGYGSCHHGSLPRWMRGLPRAVAHPPEPRSQGWGFRPPAPAGAQAGWKPCTKEEKLKTEPRPTAPKRTFAKNSIPALGADVSKGMELVCSFLAQTLKTPTKARAAGAQGLEPTLVAPISADSSALGEPRKPGKAAKPRTPLHQVLQTGLGPVPRGLLAPGAESARTPWTGRRRGRRRPPLRTPA